VFPDQASKIPTRRKREDTWRSTEQRAVWMILGNRVAVLGKMAGSRPIGARLRGPHLNLRVMAGLDPAINRRTCLGRWPGQSPDQVGGRP
jgi:hypothetical protein